MFGLTLCYSFLIGRKEADSRQQFTQCLRTDVQTGVYTLFVYTCIGTAHRTDMTQSVQNGVCTNKNEYAENKMKIPLLNIFFKTHLYLEFLM